MKVLMAFMYMYKICLICLSVSLPDEELYEPSLRRPEISVAPLKRHNSSSSSSHISQKIWIPLLDPPKANPSQTHQFQCFSYYLSHSFILPSITLKSRHLWIEKFSWEVTRWMLPKVSLSFWIYSCACKVPDLNMSFV